MLTTDLKNLISSFNQETVISTLETKMISQLFSNYYQPITACAIEFESKIYNTFDKCCLAVQYCTKFTQQIHNYQIVLCHKPLGLQQSKWFNMNPDTATCEVFSYIKSWVEEQIPNIFQNVRNIVVHD